MAVMRVAVASESSAGLVNMTHRITRGGGIFFEYRTQTLGLQLSTMATPQE
jgi:hypothetical protein